MKFQSYIQQTEIEPTITNSNDNNSDLNEITTNIYNNKTKIQNLKSSHEKKQGTYQMKNINSSDIDVNNESYKFLLMSQNSLDNFVNDLKISNSEFGKDSLVKGLFSSGVKEVIKGGESELPENLKQIYDQEIDFDIFSQEDNTSILLSEESDMNFLQQGRKIIEDTRKSYSGSKNFENIDQDHTNDFYSFNNQNKKKSNEFEKNFFDDKSDEITPQKKKNNTAIPKIRVSMADDNLNDNENFKNILKTKSNNYRVTYDQSSDKLNSDIKKSVKISSFDSLVKLDDISLNFKRESGYEKNSLESSQNSNFLNQNSFISMPFNNSDLFKSQNEKDILLTRFSIDMQ